MNSLSFHIVQERCLRTLEILTVRYAVVSPQTVLLRSGFDPAKSRALKCSVPQSQFDQQWTVQEEKY